ncbi:hypothetical protein KIN20_029492 [Parelaphostrongylus tenuis]|uniref:Uncharacterized protein n=1 Tax=Parelaphostrongylus tenuis TaxID=148309 RepID=A0AAD5R2J9_PARTN|nr:hypothetical protein KIN20_029492 [Parelaphostrongylus tenuis]
MTPVVVTPTHNVVERDQLAHLMMMLLNEVERLQVTTPERLIIRHYLSVIDELIRMQYSSSFLTN